MIKIKQRAFAVVFAIGGASSVAHSAALEEVIVTATKTSASLQDVPVAVQAFSAEKIEEANINNANDVAMMTPSLTVTSNTTPFNTKLSVRGLGTPQNDPALEPAVGLFVDGVFLGRSGLGMSDLTDIERIEVLQGPQGTLYGKNTNAGLISVVTKRPNFEETEGFIKVEAGNYEMRKLTLASTGPLSDTMAYRLSSSIHQRDGYLENAVGPDQNDADDWNVQAKMMWEPNDRLTVLLTGARTARNANCCAPDVLHSDLMLEQLQLVIEGDARDEDPNDPYDYKIAVNQPSAFQTESDLVSLKIDYDLDWAQLTAITGWNDHEYTTAGDSDRTPLDILRTEGQYGAGNSLSQELQLTASPSDVIDYQLGLFYYQQEIQRGDGGPFAFVGIQKDSAIGAGKGFASPGDELVGQHIWDSDTFAVYTQVTWHLGERLHLTGGLRWTEENREASLYVESMPDDSNTSDEGEDFLASRTEEIDTRNDPLKRNSENVDWMLKAALDVGDASMIYISAATGSKSGNFNGVNGKAEEREFDDEDTLSYELGLKSDLLDNSVRLNIAVFQTEIDNYQSQKASEDADTIGTVVVNEDAAEISGVDIQLDARPLPNLTLSAGLLYLYKYELAETARPLNHAADFSGNLAATLVFPLADGMLYLRGDYAYQGEHVHTGITQFSPLDVSDREIANSKIGWRNEQWNISIWGKNLTDEAYASVSTGYSGLSGQKMFFLTPPKTYGATLRYNF